MFRFIEDLAVITALNLSGSLERIWLSLRGFFGGGGGGEEESGTKGKRGSMSFDFRYFSLKLSITLFHMLQPFY